MKEIIEEVDDENHKIVFKVIEADLLEHYKAFTVTFHIEEIGEKQFIVWTIDFAKVDAYTSLNQQYLWTCSVFVSMIWILIS